MSLLNPDMPFCGYTVQYLIKSNTLTETYRIADSGGKSLFMKLIRTAELPESLLTKDGEPFEVALSRGIDHPAMIPFRDAGHVEIEGQRHDWLVTDYLQGELVAERLQRENTLPEKTAVEITVRILEGLTYLHSKRPSLIHNDITARNIMFDTAADGSLHPHIIDMGHTSQPLSGYVPFATSDLEPHYRAPETYLGIYNRSTDIFSVGVLLYRMLVGRMPWVCDIDGCDDEEIKERLRMARNSPAEIPDSLSPNVAEALRRSLAVASSERAATAEEIRLLLLNEQPVDSRHPASLKAQLKPQRTDIVEPSEPENAEMEAPAPDPAGEPTHRARFTKGGNGFADVAGMSELKEYLTKKVINILRDKERAERYRLSIPNGMLLYGPPGCGKTFLAEKFAEESGFNYTLVCASDLGSTFVHGSQQMIGSLFEDARKKAPVVICFDEFDALVPNRKNLNHAGQSGEVNEFLSRLNNCGKENIFVIATSNRPEMIDPAVLRTGRIDRMVYVPMPDVEARKGILAINLKGRPCTEDIDLDDLARRTERFVASDLAYLVNDAATTAAFADELISQQTLLSSLGCMRPSISADVVAEYEVMRKRMEQGGTTHERPRIGYKR